MRTFVSALVAVLLTCLVAPAAAAAPATPEAQAPCRRTLPAYPEIEPGTTSRAVRTLQCVLNDTQFKPVTVDGLTLVVDGNFGAQTEAQVKVFQDKCGENQTGRVNQQMLFNLSMGGCRGHN